MAYVNVFISVYINKYRHIIKKHPSKIFIIMSKIITEEQERPTCTKCGKGQCKTNGFSKLGFRKYSKYCPRCHKITYNLKNTNGRRYGYLAYKKDKCDGCGFVAKHKCQLDVDHIDGDKTNDNESNLQTLCANCHRLKTYLQLKEKASSN
jgi:5-methylcytosine-specific restriction endonuclease McrA